MTPAPFAKFVRFRMKLRGSTWRPTRPQKARALSILVQRGLLDVEPRLWREVTLDELRRLIWDSGQYLDLSTADLDAVIRRDLHECNQALIEGSTTTGDNWEIISLWKLEQLHSPKQLQIAERREKVRQLFFEQRSQEDMAKQLAVCEKTIYRDLKALREAGQLSPQSTIANRGQPTGH
jgi:hypothetical protein